jgi:hypothetical protein
LRITVRTYLIAHCHKGALELHLQRQAWSWQACNIPR